MLRSQEMIQEVGKMVQQTVEVPLMQRIQKFVDVLVTRQGGADLRGPRGRGRG